MNARDNAPKILHDTPSPSKAQKEVWGSDAMAAMLRALDIPYLALNPGASYRGLHDSIVNYLGNTNPQMLLCLHEESAVALAHGYAKASGKMMGAVVHSNVGLMHATMAVFNAWCDRIPMLLLGATGPWDAAKRRPWIDWIHTVSDQGGFIRDFTKWDNQPASIPATYEALMRAAQIAQTAPRGPTYINLDAALQEAKIGPLPPMPDVSRFQPAPAVKPSAEAVAQAAKLLSKAKNPVILSGRGGRTIEEWNDRIALAEKLNARVITDLKAAASFPTDHRLHCSYPGSFIAPEAATAMREADVILSLDWVDLAGGLKQAFTGDPITAKIINVSLDQHVHRGWSADYQALPPADVYLMCEPIDAVPMLTEAVKARSSAPKMAPKKPLPPSKATEAISVRLLADALNSATKGMDVCLTRLPLSWNGAYRHFKHPMDHLGYDGGGGVGSGPGMSVGAALALKGSGRLAVGVIGDGDFLMGNTALWTATHYKIPLVLVICNNRSFYNDELHQERVAVMRDRPVENKWIGQRIAGPDIDLAMMARAQGAEGFGPIEKPKDLEPAIKKALAIGQKGGVAVVDARVLPGYDSEMMSAPPAAVLKR